ncbi:WD40 repeat-like protein, partial [Schizopora paradoxa]
VASVAFSPDGKYIVSGSGDDTLRIWDADTGRAVGEPLEGHTDYPLKGHTDGVFAVAYSPDGNHIVSGSYDNTLRIWDPQLGSAIHFTHKYSTQHRFCSTNDDASCLQKNSTKAKALDSDGWLRGHKGELIFWVPSEKRRGVQDMSLMTLPLAHPEHSVALDCTRMVLGEEWMKVKVSR